MTETADEMVRDAMLLQRQNRVPESIDAYRKILARWPERADCWFNLGFLQRQVRDLERALESYARALAAGISRPEEAHLNRSVIFTDYLHQHAAAENELKLALLLNPSYVPALLNYANLCEDLGRRPEALALYLRILGIDGTCFEALARYANLQPPGVGYPTLIGPLNRALAHPAATAADHASLGFALGRLLDGAGQYPEAFAAYAAANRASRASAGPGFIPYGRDWQHGLVDRLIATDSRTGGLSEFDPGSAMAGPAGGGVQTQTSMTSVSTAAGDTDSGADGPRPIFICGMFRSGSTLAEQLLAGLPGVAAGGELDFLPRLAAVELNPFPEILVDTPVAQFRAIAARYRGELGRVSSSARFVTDKRPDNFFYIGLIKRLFPDARIVNTVRNPLDTCLSMYFLHLDHSMSYALDLMDLGHYYREYRRLMAHWKALYPGDIIDFDYDALVRDPAPTLQGLCEFLGLPWDGQMPDPAPAGRAVKTASVWQVREPLYRSSSGRSRHYAAELRELERYLADLS